MALVALITWIMTVCAGLYLLAVWLIEYDISAPGGAVSRLPRTVISGHALLASRRCMRPLSSNSHSSLP